jgi:hypothetical protein
MDDITDGIEQGVGNFADGNDDDGADFNIFQLGINAVTRRRNDGRIGGPIGCGGSGSRRDVIVAAPAGLIFKPRSKGVVLGQ